jgi:hypothetical protein
VAIYSTITLLPSYVLKVNFLKVFFSFQFFDVQLQVTTLDEGSKVQGLESLCMKIINGTHGLLGEGPRRKCGKSRLNLHGTILDGKWIDSNRKLIIWRTMMQARVQGRVQLKDSNES